MFVKILLAEDEIKIRNFIQKSLIKAGMSVEIVDSVDDIETALMTHKFDLLVLDRMLKDEDSLSRLVEFRKNYPHQKVLVLSGYTSAKDKVFGLSLGADDYLAKPFDIDELIARIRALVRRNNENFESDNFLKYKDLLLDLQSQSLSRGDEKISLTAQEFKILNLLMSYPDRIFSKAQIIENVWENNFDPHSNVVEAAMTRLRSKINRRGEPNIIHTRRGSGYWLGTAS